MGGLGLLLLAGLPRLAPNRPASTWMACQRQLKQVGTASQMWLHDYEDRFPWLIRAANGGTLGFTNVSDHFRVFSNYLASPKLLACPGLARHRPPSESWVSLGERNVSYTLGPDARLTINSGQHSSGIETILSSDMDLEGGELEKCARCAAPIRTFSLMRGKDGRPLVRWSGTNHTEGGNLLLLDGTLVGGGDHVLRQLTANQTETEGPTFHLLVPW